MGPMRQLQRQCAVPNLEASTIKNKHDSIAKKFDKSWQHVRKSACCGWTETHGNIVLSWVAIPSWMMQSTEYWHAYLPVLYFSSKGGPRRHFPGVSSALVFSGLITVLQRPHRFSRVSSLFYGQINVLRIRIFLWICTLVDWPQTSTK